MEEPLGNEQNQEAEPMDQSEARRQRREARRAERGLRSRSSGWMGGFVLILLGVVFLLQNLGTTGLFLNNWWALFILIPAFGTFERALQIYREADGQFTPQVWSNFFIGVIMVLVTAIFLFNLDFSLLGPAVLILLGVGLLFNGMVSRGE